MNARADEIRPDERQASIFMEHRMHLRQSVLGSSTLRGDCLSFSVCSLNTFSHECQEFENNLPSQIFLLDLMPHPCVDSSVPQLW